MSHTQTHTRVQERRYSAHHALLHIAKLELARAETKQPGWFNSAFIAMTFCALAIEAMANAVGEHLVAEWSDFETASPNAKVRLLAERQGISYASDAEPWRSVRWLVKFRNQVAHAKPEAIIHERFITESEADTRPTEPPESRLEKSITVGNARRAVQAVEQMKLVLTERLPAEDRFGLFADGWSTSTSRRDGA